MIQVKYKQYKATMRKLADINYAIAILNWDKEVNMPSKGVAFRTQQVSTLAGLSHEIFTAADFISLIETLETQKDQLDPKAKKNIELTAKKIKKSSKFSTEFIIKKSKVTSACYHAWVEARAANDYQIFKKPFDQLLAIKKEEAEIIGYETHPYEALLNEFEPDAKLKDLDKLFTEVKTKLLDFCKKINAAPEVDNSFLKKHYDKDSQWSFGLELLKTMSYDFEAGRQDISTHPFTSTFSPLDVRVTTRVNENNLATMTWSCIHEGGHALYEQGLPEEDYGLPTGNAASLGIHESQSRLWENNVGRSYSFWEANLASAKKYFPEQLKDINTTDFFRGINKVKPNLIRVESDELHYHFHILIRYEIEKGLLDGTYTTDELNKVWNAKYKSYLGIDVPDDKMGILQDIHWAYGCIGYFPTYSIGSFYAAQFYAQAEKELPQLTEQLKEGNTQILLEWLRDKIHQHGSLYNANELCEHITGESLNFNYFMQYIEDKYHKIYGKVL